ncbi:MAG: NAD(P)H-dependent oxidoreductase subunit E [Chloroflexi bacterium]|nr:MAG: NAD(P)H-dependent oxidoreductase subunit E [Chloroflexota bacterium]
MTMELIERDIPAIIRNAIEEHGAAKEALIPILSEINRKLGYIPHEAIAELKKQIQSPEDDIFVSESHLYSLASFYHMLSTKELGRHVIRFCESAPCHVMGGRELLKAITSTLEIKPGETTPDNKWSFITTSCLGVCGVGPVILVDEDIYGNVSPDQLPTILAKYD